MPSPQGTEAEEEEPQLWKVCYTGCWKKRKLAAELGEEYGHKPHDSRARKKLPDHDLSFRWRS